MTETEGKQNADKYNGPRFQPRPAGVKVLRIGFVLYVLDIVFLIYVAASTFPNPPSAVLSWPMGLLMCIAALATGAQLHAFWGGPRELGAVASIFQLWRKPELRHLPVLPDLPTWRIAMFYALPFFGLAILALFLLPKLQDIQRLDRNSQQFWARNAISDMETDATNLDYLRVTCEGLPVEISPQSLCFVSRPNPVSSQPFQTVLDGWLASNRRWLDWNGATRGTMPKQIEAPKLTFAMQSGGGLSGGSQTVRLPQVKEAGKEPIWGNFRLDALTRRGPQAGSVPPALKTQAEWFSKQPFDSYFVVTPLDSGQ